MVDFNGQALTAPPCMSHAWLMQLVCYGAEVVNSSHVVACIAALQGASCRGCMEVCMLPLLRRHAPVSEAQGPACMLNYTAQLLS